MRSVIHTQLIKAETELPVYVDDPVSTYKFSSLFISTSCTLCDRHTRKSSYFLVRRIYTIWTQEKLGGCNEMQRLPLFTGMLCWQIDT